MIDFYTNVQLIGNKIFWRGYNDQGRYSRSIEYRPYLFVPTDTESEYKNIHGQNMGKIDFLNVKDARDFQESHKDVKNFEIHGLNQWIYPFINDQYPGQIEYDSTKLKIVYIDIEVLAEGGGFPDIKEANQKVSGITLSSEGKSITLGLVDCSPEYPGNTYYHFKDEATMLKAFLDLWNSKDWSPDIVSGWNCDKFDIPYLVNRINRLLGEKQMKRMSPFKFVKEVNVTRAKAGNQQHFKDRKDEIYVLAGITILDYLQLYKKFTFTNHESYSLNNIAKYELEEEKLDYSEYADLDDLYTRNPRLYYAYNIHDTLLVDRLEAKLNFIQQVVAIAYLAKVNYMDAMITVRPWDVIIHNKLLEKKIVIPQRQEQQQIRELIGGYVKNPQLGAYKWIVSFDFDSLYPNVLMQHNISPDTFYKKLPHKLPSDIIKNEDFPRSENPDLYSMTANGCMYRKDIKGFIPEAVGMMIDERIKAKKKMLELKKINKDDPEVKKLNNYQQALKILANGLYGAISMKYFRWFDINLAESVTSTAQTATRFVEKKLNEYLNKVLGSDGIDYVVHCDTDSVYLNLEPLVVQLGLESEPAERVVNFLDKVCKEKLQPYIKRSCSHLCEAYSVYTPKLNMKRENICAKGIWRGAKMYILNVWDSEGVRYKEPDLKMTGIEAVRSSTPMICRNKIKEALKIIMNQDEITLQAFITDFKKSFMKMPFEDIASPRSVKGLADYSDENGLPIKATPIAVRAALMYNMIIEVNNLHNKFQKIKDNDKIRFAYLKSPNPLGSHVIGCPDDLPKEFDLHEYVDYNLQFEKTFLSPIKSVTDIIKWNVEKTNSLKGFLND